MDNNVNNNLQAVEKYEQTYSSNRLKNFEQTEAQAISTVEALENAIEIGRETGILTSSVDHYMTRLSLSIRSRISRGQYIGEE